MLQMDHIPIHGSQAIAPEAGQVNRHIYECIEQCNQSEGATNGRGIWGHGKYL